MFYLHEFNVEYKKSHLHDLISCAETLLLGSAVFLNASNEDTDIISSCQPQTHAVAFLETHHHCVRPDRWKQDFSHNNKEIKTKKLLRNFELIKLMCGQKSKQCDPDYFLKYTDPYMSWSSMLGFIGTLGGAWTLGATMGAGTAEIEKIAAIKFTSGQNWWLIYNWEEHKHLPGGVSARDSSLSVGKGGVSSTALSGALNGVAMAPIFASLLGWSSLEISQVKVSENV